MKENKTDSIQKRKVFARNVKQQIASNTYNCASGINAKDTVVVTDGELGKKLPGRNLEIDQE